METDHRVSTEPPTPDWQTVLAAVAAEYAGWPVVSLIRDALHQQCRQHRIDVDERTLDQAALALSRQSAVRAAGDR